jgi:hypothetical protein
MVKQHKIKLAGSDTVYVNLYGNYEQCYNLDIYDAEHVGALEMLI